MKQIVIGRIDALAKKNRQKVRVDLNVLKQTRLLITADSGGGKTYLIKKMIEECFGQIPIQIIDPEGEFSPLREAFDFFLIAKGGDTPPVVGLARAQAQKFLEIRASVICDIYELKPSMRHEWVKEYLEGLTEAPKSSRHPCLVIVDEAHIFAPETGKSVAAEAMADIASRGRKRGLILIVATQRLAKLNKDVTSEMLNRLVGPTFEDVNRKRAAEVLGVLKEDIPAFFGQIRMLEPGHFFALGRAISKQLIRIKIDPIVTKHGEEAAKYNSAPPPPRSRVAALLKTLTELPAEEEKKAETVREFREQIRRLRAELQEAKRAIPPAAKLDPKKTKAAINAEVSRRFRQFRKLLEDFVRVIVKIEAKGFDHAMVTPGEIKLALDGVAKQIADLNKKQLAKREMEFEELKRETKALLDRMRKVLAEEDLTVSMEIAPALPKADPPPMVKRAAVKLESHEQTKHEKNGVAKASVAAESNGRGDLSSSQLKILRAMVELKEIGDLTPAKSKVAFWSGASVTSSTFGNNISDLKMRGLLSYPSGGRVSLISDLEGFPVHGARGLTQEDLAARSRELLSSSQLVMLDAIREAYPEELSKEALCQAVGAASTKSSTFGNNVSELKTAGLITYPRQGYVKLEEWLNI